MDYETYISSIIWRSKRDARLKIDGNVCQTCKCKENLEVHHRDYLSLFNEDVETDIITLCKSCHDAITASMRHRRYEFMPIDLIEYFRVTPLMDVKEVKENVEEIKVRDWKRVSPTHA